MRLVLMGSGDFAVPVFEHLRERHEIVSVFTRVPKPAGRRNVITPTPVQTWAVNVGLPVHNSIREFEGRDADFAVVISYGVIIPDELLETCRFINVHPSDLPKYRGPSPVQTMLRNGDRESAVCLMETVHDVDAGGVYLRKQFDVNPDDTVKTVHSKVSEIAIDLLDKFLSNPEGYRPVPQQGTPTLTHKTTKNDTEINWLMKPAEIHNLVRAYGFGTGSLGNVKFKVMETSLCDNRLKINMIRPEGKGDMTWNDFLNGYGKKVVDFIPQYVL